MTNTTMSRTRWGAVAVALGCALACTAVAQELQAQEMILRNVKPGLVLGLRAGVNFEAGELPLEPGGPGLAIASRVGYAIPVPLVRFIPEAEIGFGNFQEDGNGNPTQRILHVRTGIRLNLKTWISPSFFAHIGYGQIEGEGSDFTLLRSGLSYDFGGALNLAIMPHIRLGLYGSYHTIEDEDPPDTFNWFESGLQTEITF